MPLESDSANFFTDAWRAPPGIDPPRPRLVLDQVYGTLASFQSTAPGFDGTRHRRAVWADAATAMIAPDPPSLALHRADVSTPFHPEIPSWNRVVVSLDGEPVRHSTGFVVVDISVDSADDCLVQLWRDRITRARR
jgi:hypothetical protein